MAEEVRKLAEESQQAAERIAGLIGEIQAQTAGAARVVTASAEGTRESVETVQRTREAFESIGRAVVDITVRAETIGRATSEIASVAEQSSASAEQVSAATQQTSAATQELAESAQDLSRTAANLEGSSRSSRCLTAAEPPGLTRGSTSRRCARCASTR